MSIVVVEMSKERGARNKKREKGNGYEGGKRWNLLELSCACGREEGNGRERVADGRSGGSFPRAQVYLTLVEYLSHHITEYQSFGQDIVQYSTAMLCRRELDQSPSTTLGSAMVDSPPRARALSTVLGSVAAHAPPGSHGLGLSPPATLVSAVVDHPNL
jgi:hypothetical protein